MVHRKSSDVSGSVTPVSGDKLSKIPTANAEMALQGMAPGLSVTGSGAAGSSPLAGADFWKDGDGVEQRKSNGPLVIIDGVPVICLILILKILNRFPY